MTRILLKYKLRPAAALVLLLALAGCGESKKVDPRLIGTWRSNRDETVATALRVDPRLAAAPPEQLETFKKQFGQLALTYTDRTIAVQHPETTKTFNYHVIERGSDFVVIRTQGAVEDNHDIRMRFVEGDRAYWVETGLGYSEKFDKEK